MVRLFAYVDELETKLADLSQEKLVFVQTDYDPETGEYTSQEVPFKGGNNTDDPEVTKP